MEHEIKKYANRRLYDSTESRHVTLDDIRKLIARGEKIRVTDDKTGENLTRAVLLQVISEQEQFGIPVLSIELMEAIIRFYGNPVQQMLTRYMEQSVGAIAHEQQELQARMAKAMANPLEPFAALARKNEQHWADLQSSFMSGLRPRNSDPAPQEDKPAAMDTGASSQTRRRSSGKPRRGAKR